MTVKKALICAILAVILITAAVCVIISTGVINPVKHGLALGYKYLEEGKYEEAIIAFNKVIKIDGKNVDSYLGKATAERKLGKDAAAADTIEKAIKAAISSAERSYRRENFESAVKWWIKNSDASDAEFEKILDMLVDLHIIEEYKWGEEKFETDEPYREYRELYIDGRESGRKEYTGNNADSEWVNEGYESSEPYKEYERLYLNSEPTDKVRYTGKTRPKTDEIKKKLVGTWKCRGDSYAHMIDTLIFRSDGTVQNTAMRFDYNGTYEVADEHTVRLHLTDNSGYAPLTDDGGGTYDISGFVVELKYDADSNTISVPNDKFNDYGYPEGTVYEK